MVLYVDRIKKLVQRRIEMAFISGSDEFGVVDVTIFPNLYNDMVDIKKEIYI